MAADRPQARGDRALPRAAQEAGIGGVVCHALYLVNLAAPDDAIYEKSIATMRATVDAALRDRRGRRSIFHVGSHLGAGFETGLERGVCGARRRSSSAARATPGC